MSACLALMRTNGGLESELLRGSSIQRMSSSKAAMKSVEIIMAISLSNRGDKVRNYLYVRLVIISNLYVENLVNECFFNMYKSPD